MGTVANVIVGKATVSAKRPYDEASWEEVGYTEEGVQLAVNPEVEPTRVDEETADIGQNIMRANAELRITLAEATLENLALAMCGASSARHKTILIGGGTAQKVALKAVGTSPDGSYPTRTLTMSKCVAAGEVEVPLRKGRKHTISAAFRPIKPDSGDVVNWTDS